MPSRVARRRTSPEAPPYTSGMSGAGAHESLREASGKRDLPPPAQHRLAKLGEQNPTVA
jgi:hypothetical protein